MHTRPRPFDCCEPPRNAPLLAEADRLAVVGALKALADPTRLDIFRLIAAQEDAMCVCDIVDRFAVSQPTISHHLKVLATAGLVQVTRRGIWAYYAVDRRRANQVLESLADILQSPALVSLNT